MTKMMNDMAVKPTGDVDHDFVAMKAPHHQGAIDMSEAELRYGHNEQLLRIARDIVVDDRPAIATIEISCLEVWEDEISPVMRERMEAHFKICSHCTAVVDGTPKCRRTGWGREGVSNAQGVQQEVIQKGSESLSKLELFDYLRII
jgi:hypothetical protein